MNDLLSCRLKLTMAVLALLNLSQTASASISSNFESTTEGWQIVSFADFNVDNYSIIGSYNPTYELGGGNPGHYISTIDPDDGDFTFSAPDAYLGNQAGATGLSFDLIHQVGDINWQMTDFMLVSGETRLLWNNKPDTIPGDFWTHVEISFTASDAWRVNTSNGEFATAADFQNVLSNVTGLYIHGEFTAGRPENAGIDNVSLATVPVPGAIWLFGSVLAGGIGFWRKKA